MASGGSSRQAVLAAYRGLLRAQRALFGEDLATRSAALLQTRAEFRNNAGVKDAVEIERLVAVAVEAEDFVRNGLAQGVRQDSGAYRIALKQSHGNSSRPIEVHAVSEMADKVTNT